MGTTTAYRLALPEGSEAKYLVMMEDISQGERVLGFTVNGRFTGKCIGHKRIITLPPGAKEVALEITQAKAEPVLRSIAVYQGINTLKDYKCHTSK